MIGMFRNPFPSRLFTSSFTGVLVHILRSKNACSSNHMLTIIDSESLQQGPIWHKGAGATRDIVRPWSAVRCPLFLNLQHALGVQMPMEEDRLPERFMSASERRSLYETPSARWCTRVGRLARNSISSQIPDIIPLEAKMIKGGGGHHARNKINQAWSGRGLIVRKFMSSDWLEVVEQPIRAESQIYPSMIAILEIGAEIPPTLGSKLEVEPDQLKSECRVG
ncbi:hypothetical protein B0H19DRAFT_1056815 [Mycena capillaripes]|nr:hypothetical protein B0H19DRAFT_1056815 [Mycena capillaripes]